MVRNSENRLDIIMRLLLRFRVFLPGLKTLNMYLLSEHFVTLSIFACLPGIVLRTRILRTLDLERIDLME